MSKIFVNRLLCCMFGLGLLSATPATAQTPPAATPTPPAVIEKTLNAPQNSGNNRARGLNKIIAVVDGTIISQRQLDQRVQSFLRNLQAQGIAAPPLPQIEKQALERLILEVAQLNLAKNTGVKVDDAQIDTAAQGIAAQNKLSWPNFVKRLQTEGSSEAEFKAQIRDEILIRRIQEREVASRVKVNNEEIDLFLTQANTRNEEINVAQILIQIAEGSSAEQIEQKRLRAEQVLTRAKAGESFATLSAEFSDAADALKGGEMGWRNINKVPALFVEALENVTSGGYSKVIRSANGFHVLRLLGRRDDQAASQNVQQTLVRHILVKVTPAVTVRQAAIKILQIKAKMDKQEATFAELAQRYSEDGSRRKGGELGWIFPGDTVPAFEQAMNQLAIGVVSRPVRSPFGIHLIEVLERKTAPIPAERKELQARLALQERKYNEVLSDWLGQLRGQVYVELLDTSS